MSTILPAGASSSGPVQQPRRSSRPGIPAKCKFCGQPFRARSRTNVYCSRQNCKRKRRLAYMRDYMKRWKEKHPDYWKTKKQREYLKKWREKHPEYFREYAARSRKRSGGTSTRRRRPSGRTEPTGSGDGATSGDGA